MDLNIVVEQLGDKDENVEEKVKAAFDLGFEVVALNTIIDATKLDEKNVKIPEPKEVKMQGDFGSKDLKILNRLTAVVKENIQCHHLMQCPTTKKYDIIAVQPVGEKILQHVCANLDIDIISLDLTEKLPFSLKRTYVGQAIEKGIVFEIQYAPCLRDQTARRWMICNSQLLLQVSKGKNIIISSGAWKTLELRGVHDIINLCYIFGFKDNQAKKAVRNNGQIVLSHSGTRRKTGCGYVSVEEVFQLAHQDRWLVDACRVPNVSENSSMLTEKLTVCEKKKCSVANSPRKKIKL